MSARPFGGRGSSTIAICCSGLASVQTASTRFRKARVVFAFSHAQWPSRAAMRRVPERQALGEVDVGLGGADVETVRHEVERARGRHAPAVASGAPSGSSPARRNSAQVAISGKPISAVGSSEPTLSTRAMPSVSILALPAQSYGVSARR